MSFAIQKKNHAKQDIGIDKKKRPGKAVRVILIIIAVILLLYTAFTIYINQTITAQIDPEQLAISEAPLIAYDTPVREGATGQQEQEAVMELGKNPGLGVRKLHEQGITGEGVGIAVIDQTLLWGHEQYTDRLRSYELYHAPEGPASSHGSAVAGIAVGKDTGMAPEADMYFIACQFGHFLLPFFRADFNYLAACIDRVLEINTYLPAEEKIRVVSITRGFNEGERGGKALKDAIDRANRADVFVVTTSPYMNFDFNLMGIGRDALADPDDLASYDICEFVNSDFFNLYDEDDILLFVPVDSRTAAAPSGETDYSFYPSGGLSWAVPWLAGMYALCVQVYPEITPELFISLALETGDEIIVENDGAEYTLRTVINPAGLIGKLQEKSVQQL